jgi:putative holliday junction resolvase
LASDSSHFLGIDYGSKRVGLAIASSQTHMAQRLKTLPNDESLISELLKLVKEYEISHVILGLPRNLESEDTAQTAAVRGFLDRFKDSCNVPVVLQDEALTSEQARSHLEMTTSGTIKKEMIDAEAAAIILQDYLDSL